MKASSTSNSSKIVCRNSLDQVPRSNVYAYSTCMLMLVCALIGMPILTNLFVEFLVQSKPPFRLADGDLVYCTPIQNLLEKLSTPTASWRMAPTMQPRDRTSTLSGGHFSTSHLIRLATQLMVAEKQNCPLGAVPTRSRPGIVYFRRMLGRKAYPRANSVGHLLIAESTRDYHHVHAQGPPPSAEAWLNDNDSHKYAVADVVGPYRGTQGRLNICHPRVQENEFSLAQVWVSSIDIHGKLHSLEAGWQIYRELYRDTKPRLFVYWTADDYSTTGCYNLHCAGFVQVSNKWLLGGSFVEVSTSESQFQYEIKIQIFKDRGTGDWWLQLNDENVGYWPKTLFGPGAFSDSNTRIDWGGEIWHRRGHYTDTQMGNGNHPASSGYRRVAYVRNLRIVNRQGDLHDPPSAPTSVSTYRECCHLMVYTSGNNRSTYGSTWGTYAYFGGPGFNANCVQKKPLLN